MCAHGSFLGLFRTYCMDSVIKQLFFSQWYFSARQNNHKIYPALAAQLPCRRKAAFFQHRNTQQFSYLSSLFSNLFKSLGAGLAHLATKCMCVHACVCVLPVKRREKTHRFEFVQCLPLFPAGMGFESQETKSMASTS